jgi:hypothetical protein
VSTLDIVELAAAAALTPTQAVKLQTLDDYPSSAIGWMSKLDWDWPHAVPLNDIDFSNKASWNAQANQDKIEIFKKKITRGVLKPAILVKPKGETKYVVVDGHHRALTCLELNRPLLAWTSNAPEHDGPWDIMHDQQKDGSSIKASNEESEMILRLNREGTSVEKASTVQPVGPKPLWKKTKPKPWHLPAYIEHIANALIAHGHGESEAIQIAVGVVKSWASGGGKVDANTRAAAQKALGEWNAEKAAAHGSK